MIDSILVRKLNKKNRVKKGGEYPATKLDTQQKLNVRLKLHKNNYLTYRGYNEHN